MKDRFFVYILASRYRGTLYVGVTNDLSRRMGAYESGSVAGFSKTYKVNISSITKSSFRFLKRERERASEF